MIRHILTIIWNERKSNGWLFLEYIFIFSVLWFCCDYLYYMGRCYLEPKGFDIENTYYVKMIKSTKTSPEAEIDEYTLTTTVMDRIRRHPEVEFVSISEAAMPYGMNSYGTGGMIMPDSFHTIVRDRRIDLAFLDVFRLKLQSGRLADPDYPGQEEEILISPDMRNSIGIYNGIPYPVHKVIRLEHGSNPDQHRVVTGVLPPVKDSFNDQYMATMWRVKPAGNFHLSNSTIALRIKPGTSKDFPERFLQEMRTQLSLDPYIFTSITSLKEIEKESLQNYGTADSLNSVFAITFFLIINIFLGVIGTFWYRTQARRSEIGLRITMGAKPRQVRNMLYLETLLILFFASLIAVNICISLNEYELLESLGIPTSEWTNIGSIPLISGEGQTKHTLSILWAYLQKEVTVYLITFALLAGISIFAVWYPARRASMVQPAEALREE
ncbi:MAG: FtsX-like permease family protein [Tannerellaceae bacterium]|nr:FtsX-like permease family protein [Tannerellaceae bacterium]